MKALAKDGFDSFSLTGTSSMELLPLGDGTTDPTVPNPKPKPRPKPKPKPGPGDPSDPGDHVKEGKKWVATMSKTMMQCKEWPMKLKTIEGPGNVVTSLEKDLTQHMNTLEAKAGLLQNAVATQHADDCKMCVKDCAAAKEEFEKVATFAKSLMPKAKAKAKAKTKAEPPAPA
jgi:hypothetical protein